MDGEILFPQRDDLLVQPSPLAGRFLRSRWGREKLTSRIVAELMDEDTERSGRVAETGGCLGGWNTVDEESSQRLVLTMSGIGGLEEPSGERYAIFGIIVHDATQSS